MKSKLSLCCCFIFVISSLHSSAQLLKNDSLFQKRQLAYAADFQRKSLGEQYKIFNGIDYLFYGPSFKGSPYFSGTMTWSNGSLNYNHVLYNDLSLLYDTYKDLLIVLHFNKVQQYSLLSERVQSFNLLGHHFIYWQDAGGKNNVNSGYYDELYKGNLQLLAKRETVAYDSIATNVAYKRFEQRSIYYIKDGNKFFKVKSKGDELGVLKSKRKELDRYIKTNNLNFSENRERALLSTLAYYEQISK